MSYKQPINEWSLNKLQKLITESTRETLFPEVVRIAGLSDNPDSSWRRYIFSSDFAEHRHQTMIYNGFSRSYLSILLDIMTVAERQKVLCGPYDLGNRLEVPKNLRSYAAINRFCGYQDGKKGLNPLRKSIDELSSVDFSIHFKNHPDISLKVIALLHRYKTGLDKSLTIPHLAQLLSLPAKKRPSFEVNKWKAWDRARKISWVIDELIIHLESELDQECRNEVLNLDHILRCGMGSVVDGISNAIKYKTKGYIEAERNLFEQVLQNLALFNPNGKYTRKQAYRLDLDLLIYLHRLQIEHRNAGNTEITTILSKKTVPVVNISDQISAFNKSAEVSYREVLEEPSAKKIRDFISRWQPELKHLMQLALEKNIASKEFVKACELASAFEVHSRGLLIEKLPTLNILASLCVAYADAITPFYYAPFWHGQKTPARTAFYTPNKENTFDRDDLPEGRLIFWQECQRWIAAGLIGKIHSWDLDRRLEDSINDIISECLRTHDIEFIKSTYDKVLNYAKSLVVRLYK